MSTEHDPASKAEYDRLYNRRTKYTGRGVETAVSFPCPFCCEPDWLVTRVLESRDAMSKGAVCKACGRGCRAIVQGEALRGSLQFEFVQTCGDDPPSYLPPIRRVEATDATD